MNCSDQQETTFRFLQEPLGPTSPEAELPGDSVPAPARCLALNRCSKGVMGGRSSRKDHYYLVQELHFAARKTKFQRKGETFSSLEVVTVGREAQRAVLFSQHQGPQGNPCTIQLSQEDEELKISYRPYRSMFPKLMKQHIMSQPPLLFSSIIISFLFSFIFKSLLFNIF